MGQSISANLTSEFEIGGRIIFDVDRRRLWANHDPGQMWTLNAAQAAVLLCMAKAPRIILRPHELKCALCGVCDGVCAAQDLNEIIQALRDAFWAIDPGTSYVRVIAHLGYALIVNATVANASNRMV